MRSRGSRNKNYWYWNDRRQWRATIPRTNRSIILRDRHGNKLTDPDDTEAAEDAYCWMRSQGLIEEPESPTVSMSVGLLDRIAQSYCDTQTEGKRRNNVKRVLSECFQGLTSPDQLTPAHVQKCVKRRKRGGQELDRSIICACIYHAIEVKLLPENFVNPAVAKKITVAPAPPHDVELSDSQVAAVLNNSSPEFGLFVRMCLLSGCRPGEAAKITPRHIDSSGTALVAVLLHTEWKNGRKTEKRRRIVIPAALTQEITELLATTAADQPILRTPRGKLWSTGDRWNAWTDQIKKLKKNGHFPEDARMYSFRHTAITRKVRNTNLSYDQLGELFGTSAKEIRDTYCHVRNDDLIAWANQG